MKLRKIVFTLISLVLLSSCSPFKFIDKHTKRKFKKAGLQHYTLETDEYSFSYWDNKAQDKPVFVLLHGFGSSTHLHWYKQAKLLTKTHRLILPNLLYHGTQPKGQKKHGIEDQVAAMSDLLNELKIDSMVLGGISYGGLVAAELGMAESEKTKQLVIISSPIKYFNEDDLSNVVSKAGTENLYEVLVPGDAKMMQKLGDIALYKDRKIPKFIVKDIQQNLFEDEERNRDFKALLDVIQADKEAFLNRSYEYDYPVLLVWGAGDELIPPRIGKELNEYLPTSELHLIPKAGHGPNIEQKKKFNEILLEFLEK